MAVATGTNTAVDQQELLKHQEQLQKAREDLQAAIELEDTSLMQDAISELQKAFNAGDESLYGPLKQANVQLNRAKVAETVGLIKTGVEGADVETAKGILEKVRGGIEEVLSGIKKAIEGEEEAEKISESAYELEHWTHGYISAENKDRALGDLSKLKDEAEAATELSEEAVNELRLLKSDLIKDHKKDTNIARAIDEIIALAESKLPKPALAAEESEEEPDEIVLQNFLGKEFTINCESVDSALQSLHQLRQAIEAGTVTEKELTDLKTVKLTLLTEDFPGDEDIEKAMSAIISLVAERVAKAEGADMFASLAGKEKAEPEVPTEIEEMNKTQLQAHIKILKKNVDKAIKSADKVAAKGELDEATALFKKKFGKEPVIPSADADTYIKPALAGFEPLEEPDWDSEQDVRDLIEDIKQDLKVARKSGMGVGDLEKDLAAVEEYFARSFKKPVKKKAPATAVSTAAPTTAPAPTTTPATAPAATPVTTSVAPTAPTATPTTAPATPTMDLPEDMPQVMKDVVTEVIAGDSRLEAVFGTAWALYKGLARTSVLDDEQLATIRNHFQELERTAEHPLMPADRKAAKVKSDMEKAMADISGILDRKTRRAIAEDVGRRRTLRTYSTQAPILKGELDSLVTEEDVQKRLDEMFGILELDPALFGKNADFVRKFQEGVRGVLFEDVPKKLLKRDVKDLAERVQSVGGMDIWEAATKGKDLKDIVMADRIDGIFGLFERRVGKSVADFIANPPTAEPAEEVVPAEAYEEEPELELELDEDTTPAAPAAPTPTATAAPAVAPVAAARPRRAAAEPLPDTTTRPRRAPDSMTGPRLQREISKIMNEVLSDPQLFKPDSDPVSRAIQVLITREVTEGRLDLDELKGFLQKPGAIVNARVNELVDNNNRTQLKQLLTRTRREQNKLKDDIDDARSQKTKDRVKLSTDELSALDGQIDDLRTRLNESEDEITRITTAIDLKAGNLRYKSTMQALSMIRLHIAQESGESPSDLGIMQDVDNLIAQQTEAIYKQGFLNKAGRVVYEFLTVGGLFKPTLNETLITLGKKAPEFESIGPEKMAVLAKSWNNETGVQSWIDGLKDNVDVKMTKTVPALIAYLEAALRNGNITYVNGNSLATFEGLIKHLKTARHNYITDKVADKIGPDMDDVDRMKLYFQELQRATIDQSKIDLRVIRNAGWGRGAVKTLGSAGVLGLAAGATAIGGPLTGALAAVGLAGGAVSGYKSIADADPKKKEMYGRVTKRALATTSIMCGAAAIGGGLSTVALPAILGGATLSAALPISLLAGSALGIGGVFSPELYQYREQIKKAAGVGGKGAYLFGRGAVRFASIPLSPILISRYGFINYLKWWGGGKMKG